VCTVENRWVFVWIHLHFSVVSIVGFITQHRTQGGNTSGCKRHFGDTPSPLLGFMHALGIQFGAEIDKTNELRKNEK